MTDQQYGTPPPPPKKSGLPTWAWIVLGCLLIVILGLGATCFGAAWFVKKAGDKISSYEKDPTAFAMDAAEFALKHSDEVELVSSDRENKTFTVRDKKTGKETTISLDDAENGNFSIESDGQQINVDIDANGDQGSVNITGPDGQRVQFGGGTAENVPAWVPTYPGSTPQNFANLTTGSERAASFSFVTADSITEVLDHYQGKLEAAGFVIELRSTSGDEGGLISARSEGRTLNVAGSRNIDKTETQVTVSYTEKL